MKTFLQHSGIDELLEAINYKEVLDPFLKFYPDEKQKQWVDNWHQEFVNNIRSKFKRQDRVMWFMRQRKLAEIAGLKGAFDMYYDGEMGKSIRDAHKKEGKEKFLKSSIPFYETPEQAEQAKQMFEKWGDKQLKKAGYTFNDIGTEDYPTVRDISYAMVGDTEHFLSLPIQSIQDYTWVNQKWLEIHNDFKELEKKWQEQKTQMIEYDEDDNVVKSFPDGFHWVSLDKAYCDREGKAMGHCGNSPRSHSDDNIYSLRKLEKVGDKKYWHPFVTITVDDDGMTWEIKGRGNQRPADRYIPYVVELFKDPKLIAGMKVGVGYMPENNLIWDRDFTREQAEEILEANPDFEVEEREPFKYTYDEYATAQDQLSDYGLEDDWEYLNRTPEEHEYEYYRDEAETEYEIYNWSRLMDNGWEIYKDAKTRGGRYSEIDDRMEYWPSTFTEPITKWNLVGYQEEPNEEQQAIIDRDKERAKDAVYDFYKEIDDEYLSDLDEYDEEGYLENMPDEDDFDDPVEYIRAIDQYRERELGKGKMDDFDDVAGEDLQWKYEYAKHFLKDFPYKFAFEKPRYEIEKDPNQLEFSFEQLFRSIKYGII